jgi:hypothetical protein
MARWLIDDLGNLHSAGSQALGRILGVPAQGPGDPETRERTLEDLAIINVGVIAVDISEDALHVRCRPAVVSGRAIGALTYLLLDHASSPVTISWYNRDWEVEHAPNALTAVSFVSYALELKGYWSPGSTHERIYTQHSRQAEQKWHQVRALVSPLTSGLHAPQTYAALLDRPLGGRWTIFDFDKAQGTADMIARGNGYPVLHPIFSTSEKCQDLQTLGDAQYRAWVLDCLTCVAASNRPRFDDVDALVDWPRFGTMRTRYWRLMVPLVSRGRVCRILSASGNDSGIDLRPKDVEEVGQIGGGVLAAHP